MKYGRPALAFACESASHLRHQAMPIIGIYLQIRWGKSSRRPHSCIVLQQAPCVIKDLALQAMPDREAMHITLLPS